MKIDPEVLRVIPGEKIKPANWPTHTNACYKSKKQSQPKFYNG